MIGRRQNDVFVPWAIALSAGAGASAAAFTILQFVRRRRAAAASGVVDELEEAAVEALRRDRMTANCPIDVAAIGPGIIELTGVVPTVETGQRAARLLHALEGVRTVVNRLETGTFEQRLAHNRMRRAQGEPALHERKWYGMGVGTGRRRQSTATDPGRDDDTVQRRTREIDVSTTGTADGTSAEAVSGGPDELQH